MRLAAGALLVSAAALAGAGLLHGSAESQATPASVPSARVTTELPAWLAPGAPIRVAGRTGSREQVQLLVDGRRVGRARAGRLGRFALRGAVPSRPGRYPVAVVAAGGRLALGVVRVRPVVLAGVGDVMFSEQVDRAIEQHGAAHPWTAVGAILRRADIATANLETAISTRGAPVAKEYRFRGRPAALRAMARTGGIDVVSVANNHTLDYGRAAFLDTLAHARKAGIATVGGGVDAVHARRAAVVERGGLRIAILAYSDVNPLGFPAGPSSPGAARAEPSVVAADVRAARRGADVVVVWFHWGEELRGRPAWSQQVLAGAALNSGAAVVLGAHPHVFGEVTRAPGGLVAWSLGNFVFPSFRPETRRTGILLIRLGRDGVRGHDVVPVRIDGYRPVPST